MLIDHYVICQCVLFHDKLNVLCKPKPELSFENGKLLVVLSILLFYFLLENHIIVKGLLSDNSRLVLVLVVGRYLGPVADNVNMDVFEGGLTQNARKGGIYDYSRGVGFDGAGGEDDWQVLRRDQHVGDWMMFYTNSFILRTWLINIS